MIVYHGTSEKNAVSILKNGFSLDAFYCGSLGRGIYLARDKERCREFGEKILEVEIKDCSVLNVDFKSISSHFQPLLDKDIEFMNKFKDYTESKGYKALELDNLRDVVVYDLSCIQSIKCDT
ncbi:hypothetical protein BSK50_22725 [Paenibacillus odorifer]|nr:hypothetical protein [Paenibacillus odorifer]OMD73600.1 hypothetical protein BSK50_22725 [Paenibacillus odorifer]